MKKLKALLEPCGKGRYKKLLQLIYQEILREIFKILPHNGIKVVEEDWAYLIILDACRYDVFKELNTIPGRLEKRISLGSNTPEWSKKNFISYYHDIVYVSSNPYISNIVVSDFKGSEHFFRVEHVWKYGWDEELSTIPPEEVTKAALRVKKKYPSKRMIIHYLQPHAPWIGETRLLPSKKLDSAAERFIKVGVWGEVRDMGVSVKLIRKAYKDNLKLVLSEVKKLVEELDGKIVISADHGECLGEKFLTAHPPRIYVKELVEVPWLIIEKPQKVESTEKRRIKNIIKNIRGTKEGVNS